MEISLYQIYSRSKLSYIIFWRAEVHTSAQRLANDVFHGFPHFLYVMPRNNTSGYATATFFDDVPNLLFTDHAIFVAI
jgi:hypothetical protein